MQITLPAKKLKKALEFYHIEFCTLATKAQMNSSFLYSNIRWVINQITG